MLCKYVAQGLFTFCHNNILICLAIHLYWKKGKIETDLNTLLNQVLLTSGEKRQISTCLFPVPWLSLKTILTTYNQTNFSHANTSQKENHLSLRTQANKNRCYASLANI